MYTHTHSHTHIFFVFVFEKKRNKNLAMLHMSIFLLYFRSLSYFFYILDFESVTCLDYLTDYKHVNVYANRFFFISMSSLNFHLYKIKLEYVFV